MDIYSILASKPHNPHYLNRYISFIRNCQLKNIEYKGYIEKHHICPKAYDMFPEYMCLKTNPWNCATLTAREHVIAHLILCKVFPNVISVSEAYWHMSNYYGNNINSKLFSLLREKRLENLSLRHKNTVIVNLNGKAMKIKPKNQLDLEKYFLTGYELGYGFSNKQKELMKINQGKIIINNGISHQYIEVEQDLPEGWIYGRLPDTEETKLKKSKSKIGKMGNALNHVTVKDKDGNTLSVMKDDPRFLDGTLSGINKGKTGLANHLNQKNHMCEYCGFTTTIGNYKRWHGEKCKSRF